MSVSIKDIKGIMWVLVIKSSLGGVYYEKFLSKRKAEARALILAGKSGRIERSSL